MYLLYLRPYSLVSSEQSARAYKMCSCADHVPKVSCSVAVSEITFFLSLSLSHSNCRVFPQKFLMRLQALNRNLIERIKLCDWLGSVSFTHQRFPIIVPDEKLSNCNLLRFEILCLFWSSLPRSPPFLRCTFSLCANLKSSWLCSIEDNDKGYHVDVLQGRWIVFWAPGATGPAAMYAVALAWRKDVAASPSVLRMVGNHATVLSSKRPFARVPGVYSRGHPMAGRTLSKVLLESRILGRFLHSPMQRGHVFGRICLQSCIIKYSTLHINYRHSVTLQLHTVKVVVSFILKNEQLEHQWLIDWVRLNVPPNTL